MTGESGATWEPGRVQVRTPGPVSGSISVVHGGSAFISLGRFYLRRPPTSQGRASFPMQLLSALP